jgi:AraC-like DNA-binding protein
VHHPHGRDALGLEALAHHRAQRHDAVEHAAPPVPERALEHERHPRLHGEAAVAQARGAGAVAARRAVGEELGAARADGLVHGRLVQARHAAQQRQDGRRELP